LDLTQVLLVLCFNLLDFFASIFLDLVHRLSVLLSQVFNFSPQLLNLVHLDFDHITVVLLFDRNCFLLLLKQLHSCFLVPSRMLVFLGL